MPVACHGRWFSLGTPVSSTTKIDRHDNWNIAESCIKAPNHSMSPHSCLLLVFLRLSKSYSLPPCIQYKFSRIHSFHGAYQEIKNYASLLSKTASPMCTCRILSIDSRHKSVSGHRYNVAFCVPMSTKQRLR